jgi:hypothetical protein
MFSSVAKAAPQLISSNSSFLSKMVTSQMQQGVRQFSVAFNVKSRFEDAFQKKVAALAAAPKKE